jgi:uncharacterized membrane protein YqjE
MTGQTLPVMFLASSLMVLGLLALVVGFFIRLLGHTDRHEVAVTIFLAGVIALVAGGWLLRAVQ